MTKSLLETGKHTITAITRPESTSKLPDGVHVKKVNYDDSSSIVEALTGQDALVITLSAFAHGQEQMLFQAAADAKVPWVLPNEWSPDTAHEGLINDIPVFQGKPANRKKIEEIGKISYVAVTTGFWYEWSLAMPGAFGIDVLKHEATLFDEGETKMTVSTWPQVGRAVAALLSLPIQPEGGNKERCLEHFRNQQIYVGSFTISQKDMLDSLFRVTGTTMKDWKIKKEPAEQRYKEGTEAMKQGDRAGFMKNMYTRVFFADDSGNTEKRNGLVNDVLGLPKENIDDATRATIERAKVVPAWA